jgi:hypothetical protein
MWCAEAFAILTFVGLPAAQKPGGEGIISVAQTFLQLVLLSVIMVGQNVQAEAGDVRSQDTYDGTVEILDRLDLHTQGGINDLADGIDALEAKIAGSAPPQSAGKLPTSSPPTACGPSSHRSLIPAENIRNALTLSSGFPGPSITATWTKVRSSTR